MNSSVAIMKKLKSINKIQNEIKPTAPDNLKMSASSQIHNEQVI